LEKNQIFHWDLIYNILLPYFDNKLSRLDQVYLADYNGKLLHNFSSLNSRIINNFDMEMLAPILNADLVSTAPHIPTQYKYDVNTNVGKLPLRTILKQNGHDSLVTKQKLGFNVNTISLWKSHGHALCKEYLLDSRIVKDGWINKDWINKHLEKENLDIKYVNKFLGLLAFEVWYRLFVTNEMSSDTKLN